MHLIGRVKECAEVDDLLAGARRSVSGVRLIRGEAGIGKTALLDYAERSSPGFQKSRVSGVEMEAGFPFSGLHRLLLPYLSGTETLAEAHANALKVAFGQ